MAHVSTAPTTLSVFARLRSVADTLFSSSKRYLSYRHTLRELGDLDDRLLADIGLNRSDLHSFARRTFL